MEISKILDNIWLIILICSGVLGFGFFAYILCISFLDDGISFLLNEMFFGIMTIVLLSFSYLIMVYIGRTKKDIEILEIMEQQHERTDGYKSILVFMENGGPIGTGYTYLDHGGFFLLPFIQKRKNYRDIDVKKIPFKKKFPFILLFICFFSVPILGTIAYILSPSVEEEFVSDERRYRSMMLKIKQEHREYNKCIDNNELCLCLLKNGDAVTCKRDNGIIERFKSGTTLFEYTEKRLESVGINVEDIIGHKKTSYKTSYGKIKPIEMSEEEEANLYK